MSESTRTNKPDTKMLTPQFANSREIAERVVVEGILELTTPARFGGGELGDLLDMPLLIDILEKRALITGSSIAGALRNYLRSRESGDMQSEGNESLCVALFGRAQGEIEGNHSPLIIRDALGESRPAPLTEIRDNVAIDPKTRTAANKKKFDIELLPAGERFKLRFELLLPGDKAIKEKRLRAFALVLQGLKNGEIGLGARKRRGLGACHIPENWTVVHYPTPSDPEQLAAWLKKDRLSPKRGSEIAALLDVSTDGSPDNRNKFVLEGKFSLDGSLIIRSGNGDVNSPDSVHLHSRRGKELVPILSGTSLAGALRARALRITNTLNPLNLTANRLFVDRIFGVRYTDEEEKMSQKQRRPLQASRLMVHETEITKTVQPELVQTRVKIDQFTGGAYPTGLFSEQPVFSAPPVPQIPHVSSLSETEIEIRLELVNRPQNSEIGLLLLLLKDLWTGDLALGGESSIGRGRMVGKSACLSFGEDKWKIEGQDSLSVSKNGASDTEQSLNTYVAAFKQEMQG